MAYNGSNSVSQVQISPNQRVSSGDSGSSVFVNIPGGNGTFTTAVGAANTGSATIGPGTVVMHHSGCRTLTPSPSPIRRTTRSLTARAIPSPAAPTAVPVRSLQWDQHRHHRNAGGRRHLYCGAGGHLECLQHALQPDRDLEQSRLSSAQISTQVGTALEQIDGAISNFGTGASLGGRALNAVTTANTSATARQTT